jgi:hypothetical protein
VLRHAYEVCPARRGWDIPAQAPTSPEHPAPTGSVAIALIVQPGQGDLGAPPQLVGMYEVVQALLGLLTFGLLTRRLVRPPGGTDARVIDHGVHSLVLV